LPFDGFSEGENEGVIEGLQDVGDIVDGARDETGDEVRRGVGSSDGRLERLTVGMKVGMESLIVVLFMGGVDEFNEGAIVGLSEGKVEWISGSKSWNADDGRLVGNNVGDTLGIADGTAVTKRGRITAYTAL
jgi:hypothetical protein